MTEDITALEMLTNLFNVDFMTPPELQTIAKAMDLYAIGKTRVKDEEIQRLKKLIEP